MDSPRVLVTSAGRRGQLVQWFKEQLGDQGKIIAVDASASAPAAYLADEWILVPRVDSGSYIEALISTCRMHAISLLIPTIDTELQVLAEHRNRFAEIGTTVAISSPDTIALSIDKKQTHDWLSALGFPVPQQQILLYGETWPTDLGFPVFIKPLKGSRSVGTRKLTGKMDVPQGTSEVDFVIEEFVQGDEFTVSVYINQQGECLAAVPRQRLEVRDGEVSKAVTRSLPEMEELARSIGELLPGAWGPLNIQIIRDPNSEQMWIIEINARFGGGDPLAWHAGANMPKWLIAEAMGERISTNNHWVSDMAMLRFDNAIYIPWSPE